MSTPTWINVMKFKKFQKDGTWNNFTSDTVKLINEYSLNQLLRYLLIT